MQGTLWTVAITVLAGLLSYVGGILFAVVALYAPALIRWPFRLFEALFMGTPLLLQLFLIYFGLIQIGIDLPEASLGVFVTGGLVATLPAAVGPMRAKALTLLDGYGHIYCFLDNDAAGKRALEELGRKFGPRMHDMAPLYEGYKDLNDCLVKHLQDLVITDK